MSLKGVIKQQFLKNIYSLQRIGAEAMHAKSVSLDGDSTAESH